MQIKLTNPWSTWSKKKRQSSFGIIEFMFEGKKALAGIPNINIIKRNFP